MHFNGHTTLVLIVFCHRIHSVLLTVVCTNAFVCWMRLCSPMLTIPKSVFALNDRSVDCYFVFPFFFLPFVDSFVLSCFDVMLMVPMVKCNPTGTYNPYYFNTLSPRNAKTSNDFLVNVKTQTINRMASI